MNGDTLIGRLRALLGEAAVIADADGMAPYLADWRGRYRGSARCVLRPGSTEEVVAVVRMLAAAGVPMVPQGGNTGLCGGATADGSGRAVVIQLGRLQRVRAIDATNNTITVEAGCTLRQVQDAAAEADRLFPLSLAAEGSCEIGGNLSTNAGGVHVLRYGNTRELTLGLEVVLPDGRLWDGLRGLRKDNTGYDLKHLFLGAEGTLGIITAAVLKLFPRPKASAVAWLAVDSVAAAVDLLSRMRSRFGERITAFELIGRSALELVLKNIPRTRPPLLGTSPWSLLIEAGESLPDVDVAAALEAALAEEMESGRVADAAVARSLAQAQDFWRLRENISEAQKVEGVSIKHDIAVPVSRIPEFIARADTDLALAFPGVRIVAFGHVGDGNLHYNLSQPEAGANAEFIALTPRANRIVHDIVASLGGSISAEHGLGQLKRGEILRYKSEVEMDLMRAVKRALDPHNVMNPGKVL
ncbi:MAG: hydroxyacid dehydrogenase [Proteobacteria bacterium]|nr:hydroxyacid dehydrogenase [Pseudomonadota bacterium]